MGDREHQADSHDNAGQHHDAEQMSAPSPLTHAVQRKLIQRRAASQDGGVVQAMKDVHEAGDGGGSPAPKATGGGAPLPDATRASMEGSFGADFGDVRVHQGNEAKDMGAVAYAQGNDMHFAPGQYNPTSSSGKELLGHELAHVVQQRSGRVATPQGKDSPINSDASLEAEADAAGSKVAAGQAAHVSGAASSSSSAGGAVQAKLEWNRQTLERAGAIKSFAGLRTKTGGGDKYKEILGLLDKYHDDPVLSFNPHDGKLKKLCGEIVAACSVYMTAHAADTGAEKGRVDAVSRLHIAALTEWNTPAPTLPGPRARVAHHDEDEEHEDESHDDASHDASVPMSDAKALPSRPPPPPARLRPPPPPARSRVVPSSVSASATPTSPSPELKVEAKVEPTPAPKPEAKVDPKAPTPPGLPSVAVSTVSASISDRKKAFESGQPVPAPLGPKPGVAPARRFAAVNVESKAVMGADEHGRQAGDALPKVPAGEREFFIDVVQLAKTAVESGKLAGDGEVETTARAFITGIWTFTSQASAEGFRVGQPFTVRDNQRILDIASAIQKGDVTLLRTQLELPPLNDGKEDEVLEEDQEEKTPLIGDAKTPAKKPYLARQADKRDQFDAEIDAMDAGDAHAKGNDAMTSKSREKKAKMVTKLAVSQGLGLIPIAGNVFNVGMALKAARSSHEHAKKIRKIREDMVNSGRHDEGDDLTSAADYAVKQKTTKRFREGVNAGTAAVPVAGTVVGGLKTAFLAGRSVLKRLNGTKGVDRRENARELVTAARGGDGDAKLIVLELFGNDKEEYLGVIRGDERAAIDMVMTKLASS